MTRTRCPSKTLRFSEHLQQDLLASCAIVYMIYTVGVYHVEEKKIAIISETLQIEKFNFIIYSILCDTVVMDITTEH